ncbi:hypothetical protein GGR54DRAFT_639968 [Hypoxylon sp. NC1633]|nr:hypothetical protein GGR54DRAFT_639968 [Hypoxylon sp. NC1633]
MAPPQKGSALKCSSSICKGGSLTDLLSCAGCKQAKYCSRECQKQDWTSHKTFCKHVSTNGASSKSLDIVQYHIRVAAHDPKAKALARNLGITLQACFKTIEFRGIRRLIITGKDTPQNLSLFFGQNETIWRHHHNMRLEALMRPPPGSPSYVQVAMSKADENCPSWTPREPSATETKDLEKIRVMQNLIRSHMGARGVEDVSSADMSDILVKNFGDEWSAYIQTYTNALNTMDRGVRDPGFRYREAGKLLMSAMRHFPVP